MTTHQFNRYTSMYAYMGPLGGEGASHLDHVGGIQWCSRKNVFIHFILFLYQFLISINYRSFIYVYRDGNRPAIRTGIRAGLHAGIHSGIHSGILAGIHAGIHSDIRAGIHTVIIV